MIDEQKARARVLAKVVSLVLDKYFNLTGVDLQIWARHMKDREPDIVKGGRQEFEASVSAALRELGTSHTAFYSEHPIRFPPQYTIGATLSPIGLNGSDTWMFVDVFEDGPAYTSGIQPGDLLLAVNGVEAHSSATPSFGTGSTYNLAVATDSQQREARVIVPFRKGSKVRPPLIEPKSISHRMLTPGIGLLKVLYFPGSVGLQFGRMIAEAMGSLTNHGAEALVLDLRGNIGGSLGFASLVSYLCPDQRPIGYSVTPRRLREGYTVAALPRVAMPSSRFEALMALSRFAIEDKSLMLLTQGLGARSFQGQVVVLVNEWTTSAGEMTAAFAAQMESVSLVGRTTRGAVLGASNFDVGQDYWLRLPVFGWFTPSGRCLEGSGVEPSVSLPTMSPEALRSNEELRQAIRLIGTVP